MPQELPQHAIDILRAVGATAYRLINEENEPGMAAELASRCQKAGVQLPILAEYSHPKIGCYAHASKVLPLILYSTTIRELLTEAEMTEILSHELIHIRHGKKQNTRRLFLTGAGATLGATMIYASEGTAHKFFASLATGASLSAGWALGSRLSEIEADKGAILEFGGNPDIAIRALQKISQFRIESFAKKIKEPPASVKKLVESPFNNIQHGNAETRANRILKAAAERSEKKDIPR